MSCVLSGSGQSACFHTTRDGLERMQTATVAGHCFTQDLCPTRNDIPASKIKFVSATSVLPAVTVKTPCLSSMRKLPHLKSEWLWYHESSMSKLVVRVEATLFLKAKPLASMVDMRPGHHACHFWRLQRNGYKHNAASAARPWKFSIAK